ncbi:ABC transporter permease [Ketogulonicigenium vulgare]|uniref:ABC transporter permease n=1 Tax=Ketogulonicigenium vulgare TaxID=92945 RepID=UPI002358C494|nr:ABC transporter permease [Ketogulonicigenium vulgare]
MMSFLRALLRSKGGLIGAIILLVLVAVAIGAPLLDLPNPIRGDLRARLVGPTWEGLFAPGAHPFGTDPNGRDILARVIYGARISLSIALAAVLLGALIGVTLGIVAGFTGGWVDAILMRLVDMQLAFPLVLFALLVVAALGPSLTNLIIVLGITSWTQYARIVRGQVLALREREFVLSARAAGAGSLRIMARHILPNVMTPVLVVGTLELARIIVMDAALSFLGLGVQPPTPSWGRMLADGRVYITSAWWVVTFPGLAIALTVLSVNLLGDWLRDYFDPKARQ